MAEHIPFEMKLPQEEPSAYASLIKEQFDAEIEKGIMGYELECCIRLVCAGNGGRDVRRQLNEKIEY